MARQAMGSGCIAPARQRAGSQAVDGVHSAFSFAVLHVSIDHGGADAVVAERYPDGVEVPSDLAATRRHGVEQGPGPRRDPRSNRSVKSAGPGTKSAVPAAAAAWSS